MKKGGTGLRSTMWPAVASFIVLGVGLLGLGVLFAGSVPPSGNARLEAIAQAVTTAGGTVSGIAVALAAVWLALNLEQDALERDRHRRVQLDLLQQSLEWIQEQVSKFGEARAYLEAAANAVSTDERTQWEGRATTRMSTPRNPSKVDLLVKIVEADAAVEALQKADVAIRTWNESVSGDHIYSDLQLRSGDAAATWEALDLLYEARDEIEAEYVRYWRSSA